MRAALYLLLAVATVLAWLLARARRDHLPIALLLSTGLLCNVVRAGLRAAVPTLATSPADPLAGWARAAAHLDDLLFLAWPAGLAVVAVHVLARAPRWSWAPAAALAAIVAGLAGAYPVTRGDVLRRCYLAAELAALAVGVFGVVQWARRGERATPALLCAAFLVLGHFVVLVGPYRFGLFGSAWYTAQVGYLLILVNLVLVQGAALWSSWRRSS